MTKEEIDAIAALEAAATAEPWVSHDSDVEVCVDHDDTAPRGFSPCSTLDALRPANAALIVALRNNAKALLRAAQQHELLSDQVNWFDASTHHGDWGPADVDATGLVSPKAVCRICQHASDWHYPSAQHDQHVRGKQLEAVTTEVAAHREFQRRLASFLDVQSGLSTSGPIDRYRELFDFILALREELLEKPGYYRMTP